MLYRFDTMFQNCSSQTLNFRGKRDLSAFLLFRVEKCHRSKKNAPESVPMRRIFTKKTPDPSRPPLGEEKKTPSVSHIKGGGQREPEP